MSFHTQSGRIWGIPPMAQGLEKWNAAWEETIKKKTLNATSVMRAAIGTLAKNSKQSFQTAIDNHRQNFNSLCTLQRHLSSYATSCFVQLDFESKWLLATNSTRETHLLQGLMHACRVSDYDRIYCNELTLPYLQDQHGHGFLRLLKHFVDSDFTNIPSQPIHLVNPLEGLLADTSPTASHIGQSDSEEKTALAFVNVSRSTIICNVLFGTIMSFHGTPIQNPIRMARSQGTDHLPKSIKPSVAARDEHREARKSYEIVCESCLRAQSDLEGVSFLCCAVCKKTLDRRVFYCSKQCQIEDWNPRHKRICGKLLTVEDAEATAVPSRSSARATTILSAPNPTDVIGPAINGFKRSPALIWQINYLNASSSHGIDYVLLDKSGQPFPFRMEHPELKAIFRRFRDKAFTTGEITTVVGIARLIAYNPSDLFGISDLSRKDVLRQLTKEFGFDVEKVIYDLAQSGSADEMGEKMAKVLMVKK